MITYAVEELDFDVEEIIKRSEQQIFKVANQKYHDGSSFRNSNVTWIDESDKDGALPWPELTKQITQQVNNINNKHWGFDLLKCEPLQYSIYNEGDYYNWHNDQRESVYEDGLARKLSFTIFLNEDYDGGDFEIELKLNEDRTLTMKIFNRENTIRNLGEQIGYTQGVGISYKVEFNSFKKLLNKLLVNPN